VTGIAITGIAGKPWSVGRKGFGDVLYRPFSTGGFPGCYKGLRIPGNDHRGLVDPTYYWERKFQNEDIVEIKVVDRRVFGLHAPPCR